MILKACLLAAATFAGSAFGQTPPPAGQPVTAPATRPAGGKALLAEDWPAGVRPFGLNSPTITDDWFGLGPAMRDLGIDLKYFWNSHYFSVMGGGSSTDSGKHSATYDLLLGLDFEKMGLIQGGEMLVHVRQQWGRSVNPWVGPPLSTGRTRSSAQQVNDDADYDETMYIDQLWYRQNFFGDRLALQIGYLDYQTIGERNVCANGEDKQFMNAALDNNPLIPPASAAGLGAALYVKPCDWYTLILGLGDAQRLPLYKPGFSTTFHDEAWFLGYMEHDVHVKVPTERGPLSGNYRFGLIYDPIPRNVFVRPGARPRMRGDDYGFYTSFDQMLLREGPDDNQGLGTFFRYAYRHDDIPHDAGFFSQFWSGGLAYTGLLPTRDKDTLGFAVAQLIRSSRYRSRVNPEADNETIYELYYAIQVTPWLVLTPDIQYIDNPGGRDDDEVSHAIAGGFKVRLTF